VFYLATSPDLFGPVCRKLGAAGAVTPNARVVLEKPVGRDAADVSFMTVFGEAVFEDKEVVVRKTP